MSKLPSSEKSISGSPEPFERYQSGWRTGKPIEDPEKLKRWGFVSARPSEYLIAIKNGKIDTRRSGQGPTVFKLPWETLAIVPTTLQRIEFAADQITRERVGVRVTGIAVYRIVEPELAFRVLNFSFGERASEKLAGTLREMFVGASRRLIANLTLDECLMKRKEAIATFLMEEISPVVSGEGSADDRTDQGWGVVLDTIEIQDVRILSAEVFSSLQAPFRAQLLSQAQVAELEQEREVAERRAETERRIAEVTLQGQREARALKARAETEAAEIEAEETLKAERARARVSEDELERKRRLAQTRVGVEEGIALRETESAATVARKRAELDQARDLERIRRDQAQALEKQQLEQARELEKQQHEQARALARLALEQEQALSQAQSEENRRKARAVAELAALQAEARLREEEATLERLRLEREREQQSLTQATELELVQERLSAELEMRRLKAEVQRLEQQVHGEKLRLEAEVRQITLPGEAMLELVRRGLPEMAKALQGAIGPISYTHVGGGEGSGMPGLAATVGQVMAVAKGFGLDPAKWGPSTGAGNASSQQGAQPAQREDT